MRRSVLTLVATAALHASLVVAQPSTVILVRHAEKASLTDPDPLLTDLGMRRAKDLAAALADAHVTTVITSQYQRTRLTGAPLVEATKPTLIVVANSGNTAAHIGDVAAAVRARPLGEVVLVIGHSSTIPAIIGALGGPRLAKLCESQYSMLFILEMNRSNTPRLIRANYGAPDVADPTCPKERK